MDVDEPQPMDVNKRHRAVCAIGGIRRSDRSPLLMGSGYCVNGQHRILCSCAHVWNDIAKAASLLDPAAHGVAIGFRPDDRARAERGEVDWVGRAVLLSPPGVLHSPSFNPPSNGLDLVVLQLTHLLDSLPLPPDFPPLVALPLGDPDSLRSGDELTMLGFAVIGGQANNRGNARPRHPQFSNISDHPATGRFIETGGQEMAHSGHSGGPVLGPHGEIVAWVVWTVGPRAVGARADGLPLDPPVSVLVAGVDQLRPVDKRFEDALSEALDALLPATNGNPLRDRLATGGQTLPLTAGSAGHTAAAAREAQATADRAQAAADGARTTAQNVQQAMLNEQCHQILAIDQQLQRTELEVDQLRQQRALRVQALPAGALQRIADQLNQTGYSLSVRGQQDWPWFSNVPQVQHEQTPLLRSASTSRESSPGRSCCADFGLVIDGDYPNFTDDALDAFKSRLAMLLGNEVTSRDISIRPAMRGRERSACVTTGSCEVEVNFVVFGSGGGRSGSDDSADEELDAEEERIEYILRGLPPTGQHSWMTTCS